MIDITRATADQRALVNFGGGDLLEERAVAAESVLGGAA